VWMPAFMAMPGMLKELSTYPDSGFLGCELLLGRGGPYVVQYWSSIDKLYAYSTSPSQQHLPAWTKFNQAVRKTPGVMGVWHETFLVERAESIFVSTREMGLAKATELVEVGRRSDRARARFEGGRTEAGVQ